MLSEIEPSTASRARSSSAANVLPAGAATPVFPSIDGRTTADTALLPRARHLVGNEVSDLSPRFLLVDFILRFLPAMSFSRLRAALYRLGGLRIGAKSAILGRMEFTETRRINQNLQIGIGAVINKHFFADVTGPITIGDNVSIGHHAVLITASHDLGPASKRCGELRPLPIVIEAGTWVGACCTILPGVRIGAGSVVAAGSLVTTDVPANKLVGGVPARVIKSLPPAP